MPEIILHRATDDHGTGAGENGESSVLFGPDGVMVFKWGTQDKAPIDEGETISVTVDRIIAAVDIEFAFDYGPTDWHGWLCQGCRTHPRRHEAGAIAGIDRKHSEPSPR